MKMGVGWMARERVQRDIGDERKEYRRLFGKNLYQKRHFLFRFA
jgi:hypothetical protein